ncbi:GNAT family N-acetyltransferase [Caulobacter sp. S45]|uniref:GNAT family N-acetyltransferase n=1 Tax=Caulobacter sp. S45 TaxID=1641861 RepID=UPI00131C9368|nr:N-acetyltransferase [Caulobacter sp. S45]
MNAISNPSRVPPSSDLAVRFQTEQAQDAARVDALIDQAFGPGRFAKTAERLREASDQRMDLSICAWSGETLVGAVRLWSIRIGETPALFLGPIEVRPDHRRQGLAAALTERACEAGLREGDRIVLLVGGLPIFASQGFEPTPPGRVALPGPVDPRRVLWRGLVPGVLDQVQGRVAGLKAA